MRRVAQLFVGLAAAFSLLLFVTLAVLLVFTWSQANVYVFAVPPAQTYFVESAHGSLRFVAQRATPASSGVFVPNTSELGVVRVSEGGRPLAGFRNVDPARGPFGFRAKRHVSGWIKRPGTAGGVGLADSSSTFHFAYTELTLPYWFLLLATAAGPVVRVLRRERRLHAMTHGRCPTCGYDLRASPGRCPECGTASKAVTA